MRQRSRAKPKEPESESESDSNNNVATNTSSKEVSNTGSVALDFSNKIMRKASDSSKLSSESSSDSFRGMINFAILSLFLSNLHEVTRNFLKYGLLVSFDIFRTLSHPNEWPAFSIAVSFLVYISFSLTIQKMAVRRWIGLKTLALLHTINCIACIIFPAVSIWTSFPHVVSAAIASCLTVITWMKLTSYAHINWVSHERWLATTTSITSITSTTTSIPSIPSTTTVVYPNNVNIKDLAYFMAVPTLVYNLNFPRTERIRKRWLARRLGEFAFFCAFILFVVEQYMMPVLVNSVQPFTSLDYMTMFERLLRLTVPNIYTWILIFYTSFHLAFNIIAEILRFKPREFYLDWWNSTTLEYFWRTWNLPVHHWFVVHIYLPLKSRGYSKSSISVFIFFVSAVFHEFIVALSFHVVYIHMFNGMMAQIPLVWFTRVYTKNQQIGNIIFWISLMIGQPFVLLNYACHYLQKKMEHDIELSTTISS